MSKSNKTTKTTTFLWWKFEAPQGGVSALTSNNAHDCVGAMTTAGLVAGTNTFTGPIKGDRVILRADAPRSYDADTPRKWVMTGIG